MNDQPRCNTCQVRNRPLCRALTSIEDLNPSRVSMIRRLPPGRLLLSGHRPTNWFGLIVSGVVKLLISEPSGRQQIVGLQFPGDYLGAPGDASSQLIAEAATRVELCCFPRTTYEALLAKHATIGNTMLRHTYAELESARQWMLVLGNKSAIERLAAFLTMLEQRLSGRADATPPTGAQSQFMELPLSRAELAEYLGLSIETISRQFKQMKDANVLETQGRRMVRVLDWDALHALATPAID